MGKVKINAKGDNYVYLTRAEAPEQADFVSKLAQLLREGKQGKAPPKQWASFIAALTSKGVKASEIEDSRVVRQLEASEARSLTKEELADLVEANLPTIKEIELSQPQYGSWRHPGGRYKELLFILNSAKDNVEDEIAEIEQRMDDLKFDAADLAIDLAKLMDDPELPDRLAKRLAALHAILPVAWTYGELPHFSGSLEFGDKNMMAHARITERGPLFFIEEVQSDWAQGIGKRTRAHVRTFVYGAVMMKTGVAPSDAQVRSLIAGEPLTLGGQTVDPADQKVLQAIEAGKSMNKYAHVPFVNNTEAWAGLIVRRLLQRAALDPAVEQVAWITEGLRNGKGGGGERNAYSTGKAMDDFYKLIIPKVVDKLIKPAGEKVTMGEVQLTGYKVEVPQFKMTPEVRKLLIGQPMPLYSRSPVWAAGQGNHPAPQQIQRVLGECAIMLGSPYHVRTINRLVDLATGREVAGQYLNKAITLSLQAKDLERAARHEVWHFAVENMLTEGEKSRMRSAFAEHRPLALRTRAALIELGEFDAARQCSHPEECAAHAFALWSTGRLDVQEPEPRGIFAGVWRAFNDLKRWVADKVAGGEELLTPEDLFQSLRSGALAELRDDRRGPVTALRELEVLHEAPREAMRA